MKKWLLAVIGSFLAFPALANALFADAAVAAEAGAPPAGESGAQTKHSLPFSEGEELFYDVRYLGVKAAEAKLRVSGGPAKRMRLVADAHTVGASESLMGLRASATCTITPDDLVPTLCRNSSERKGNVRRRELRIDHRGKKVRERTIERGKLEEKEISVADTEDLHDALSALYFLRHRLPEVQKAPLRFPSMRRGKEITVEARFAGTSQMETALGTVEVAQIDLRILEAQEEGATTQATLWLATGAGRLPVRLSLAAPVGSIEAELTGAKGTLASRDGTDASRLAKGASR